MTGNSLSAAVPACAILLRVRCAISASCGEKLPRWIAILAWLARYHRLGFDTFGAFAMPFWALSAQVLTEFPGREGSSHACPYPCQGRHHRVRPCRVHRGDLLGTSDAGAYSDPRHTDGGTTQHHHRRGKLSGLSRCHPQTMAVGADGKLCHALRNRDPNRNG